MRLPPITNLILAATALAGAVYGVDKIGGRQVAPGTDTGFEWRSQTVGQVPRLLLTRTRLGDVTCRISLTLSTSLGDIRQYRARFIQGKPLGLYSQATGPNGTVVELALPRVGTDTVGIGGFRWISGDAIELVGPAGAAPLQLSDWSIYLSDADADTELSARKRHTWEQITLALYVIFLLGTTYQVVVANRRGDLPPTESEMIDRMIDSVMGKDKTETKQFRRMLKQSRRGVTPKQAIRAAGLDPSQRANRAKWLEAIRALSANVHKYCDDLLSLVNRLSLVDRYL